MPAQPDETQLARTRQATGPRGGPRDARGRRRPRRSPSAGRWGALQGGLGVCIIVASAAVGTIATMVTKSAPGFLLGLFVEAGTVVAALAVRPRAGRMIFPVPVLCYLVGALISGFVFNRSGTSRTALAIGAAQWVANGFFAMALATVLAVAIVTTRWYLWRRGRPSARDTDRAAQARPSRAAWKPAAEPGYPTAPRAPEGPRGPRSQPGGRTQPGGRAQPGQRTQEGRRAQGAWDDADPRGSAGSFSPGGPHPPGPPRGTGRPGPRPGTGPYNFSSGA